MKIIYDYQIFGRQLYGGISRYFFEIFKRISEIRENKVEIVAPVFVNQYLRTISHGITGNYIPKIPKTGKIIEHMNRIISKILLNRSRDTNVFHETYYADFDLAPRNAVRVTTVHDMINEKFPDLFSKWDKTANLKKIAISRADHIICVSENTLKDMLEFHNVDVNKTSIIYLGHSILKSIGSKTRKIKLSKPFILYVGARSGYKNFKTLLEAFATSKVLKSQFDLICFGSIPFTPQEINLMKLLGIKESSFKQFSGDDGVLGNLYSSASVYICPSLYEGFGIPPLEAMSHDCPVVCSKTSSLPEVVGDAALMFDPRDASDIAQVLESVATSSKLRKELIERGKQRLSKFSWAKCASETLELYKKLVNEKIG